MEIKDYKSAFEFFKKQFLEGKNSIFTENENILSEEVINYLINNFINNPKDDKRNFLDKIKEQLFVHPKEKNEKILKNVTEVLAHIYYVWRLIPVNSSPKTTQKEIESIFKLYNDLSKSDKLKIKNDNVFKYKKGFASVGTYYHTNKPFEFGFVIYFLKEYLNSSEKNFIKIVSNLSEDITFSGNKNSLTKKASIKNALLYLFDSIHYEPIISYEHKNKIVEKLGYLFKECENRFKPETDYKLFCIKQTLIKKYPELANEEHFFYHPVIKELWDETLLPGKNIIYYGPPGTGKTYKAIELIQSKTKSDKYYKILQFHPSFDYDDFIDGIKPKEISNGNINLTLVNGEFKQLCIEAFKELYKNRENAKKFFILIDEINRAELSRVFGEILVLLEEDKRLSFDKEGNLQGLYIKTKNSHLWDYTHAVLTIKDKEVKIPSKEDNKEDFYFGIPENIYFVATMNNIDRSIDTFDLALRRRFKWIYKGYDENVVYDALLKKEVVSEEIDKYLNSIKKLNEHITKNLGLSKDYEIGHSYFLKIRVNNGKISKNSYKELFELELKPLLDEYLRGEISEKDIEQNINEIRKKFTNHNDSGQ